MTDIGSKMFKITPGAKQGDLVGLKLSNVVLEHVLKEVMNKWRKKNRLCKLRFTDDLLLFAYTKC